MSGKVENVKWVDGLRGIASLLVVFVHITRAFDDELFGPANVPGGPAKLFQLPYIRILIQGRTGVAIFSLVTGYVCALKPFRQFAAREHGAAFTGIAKSAFRRIPRLLLPATFATTAIWFLCQFGAFTIAKRADGWWLAGTTPNMTPYIGPAIYDLLINIIRTWTISLNAFDPHQWNLLPLLKGAFVVYVMLFATAYMKPRYRMIVEMGLFWYYYICSDATFGMQFFWGVFLSDLEQHQPHLAWMDARKWPSRFLSPILIFIGLTLASYPESRADFAHWSTVMGQSSVYIFPEDCDTPRFYTGLGLVFISLGIHFSNGIKSFLSNKYLLWFGKNSFAVYLIHGCLIRTLLTWMMLGIRIPADVIDQDGQVVPGPPLRLESRLRWYTMLPLWFVILYYLANLWTKHVDSFCGRVTQKLEKYVFMENDSNAEKPILPQ